MWANTLSKPLREQGIQEAVHRFRSSFRDWCVEWSNAPREVCEPELAHVNMDRVELTCMKSDLFEGRGTLMQSRADRISEAACGSNG